MPFAESEAKQRYCVMAMGNHRVLQKCIAGDCMAWEVMATKGSDYVESRERADTFLKMYPEVYKESRPAAAPGTVVLTRLQDIGDCMMKQQRTPS